MIRSIRRSKSSHQQNYFGLKLNARARLSSFHVNAFVTSVFVTFSSRFHLKKLNLNSFRFSLVQNFLGKDFWRRNSIGKEWEGIPLKSKELSSTKTSWACFILVLTSSSSGNSIASRARGANELRCSSKFILNFNVVLFNYDSKVFWWFVGYF